MFRRILTFVSFAAAILLGLILIASGTGKLFGDIETSSQVMAFVNDLLPEALLVPPVIYFIYNILVPYLFPIAELILGLCMLFGLVPALAALISLPLMLVFMATNIWALTAGGYETCAGCFGLWEEIFGHLSPAQSLIIDIFMIVLALLVIVIRPGGFFYSRQPVSLIVKRRADAMDSNGALQTCIFGKFRAGLVAFVSRAADSVRYHPWAYAGFLLGVLGIVLSLLVIFNVMPAARTELPIAKAVLALTDNVTVTDISHENATVNFTTAEPEIIDLLVYDRRGRIAGTWPEDRADSIHRIELDNLAPATTYYLQILFSDRQGGKNITQKYEFSTTETPPAIFDVIISGMTENSVSYIWETDRPTIAEVTVVQMDTMDEMTFTDEQLDTFHYMRFEPLTADKDYSFSIRAIDASGHQLSTVYTGAFTLKTGGRVGQRAPLFNLPSIAGERISLSQYAGKTVILVFWNITCPVCRTKLPLLQEINDKESSDNFALLTVHGPGREAAVRSFLEGEEVSFTVLLDSDGAAGYSYGIVGVPAVFIIDGAGIVRMVDPEFNDLQGFKNIIAPLFPVSRDLP